MLPLPLLCGRASEASLHPWNRKQDDFRQGWPVGLALPSLSYDGAESSACCRRHRPDEMAAEDRAGVLDGRICPSAWMLREGGRRPFSGPVRQIIFVTRGEGSAQLI